MALVAQRHSGLKACNSLLYDELFLVQDGTFSLEAAMFIAWLFFVAQPLAAPSTQAIHIIDSLTGVCRKKLQNDELNLAEFTVMLYWN